MEKDFGVDLGEVMRSVDKAEVLSIFFPRLRKSLIVDTRFTIEDRPMVKVVHMTSSFEERLRSIRRMRPSFPRPVNVTLIPWLSYVDGLVHSGVWDRIVQRFVDSAHKDAIRSCNAAIRELRRLERMEMAAAVLGDGYRTLWSRQKQRR